MSKYNLICGNSLEVLKTLEDNSVDSIVTDPPYELGFMGKSWDSTGIAFNIELWQQALRVLKPGGHLLAFSGTRTVHRMVCAIEDAGFQIRDMITWNYGCYSQDTECLTDIGWKNYKDLSLNDKILQWNSIEDTLVWKEPKQIFEYDIDDELVQFNNRHTNQLLTKNHRCYVNYKASSKKEFCNGYEVLDAKDIQDNYIVNFPLASKLLDGIREDNAYLIGWWLTDAWLHKDGKACMFSQSKHETLAKLRDYLSKNNYQFSEYVKKSKNVNHKDEHTFYVTGNIADYLISNFKNRELTMEVLQWDYESRLNLLKGLIDGDGSIRSGKNYSQVFWSIKKDRLDVFSALCLSLNYRSHIDYKKGCVYFNVEKNTTQLQKKHREENIKYSGKVWCLETDTGAFVVRRNGKPFISGNSGFPKSLDISKAIDKKFGAEREVVGSKEIFGMSVDGQWQNKDRSDGKGSGFKGGIINITTPSTEEAKQWQGWGTALKPSIEPICVARKPLSEKTVAENVLKWGVGGLNIDGCRVETSDEDNKEFNRGNKRPIGNNYNENTSFKITCENRYNKEKQGRWPANFIHDGSLEQEWDRFFYCAKASKKDRNEGCETMPLVVAGGMQGRQDGSMGSITYNNNHHPTVKPTDLMAYLVRLVTPQNGTVLDPFNGSGSTGKACAREGFNYIGIDLSQEYLDISKARIEYELNKKS